MFEIVNKNRKGRITEGVKQKIQINAYKSKNILKDRKNKHGMDCYFTF